MKTSFFAFCTILIIVFFSNSVLAQTNISATELIYNSIQYHDQDGVLFSEKIYLDLNEKRPNGSDRKSTVIIDIPKELYILKQIKDSMLFESSSIKGVISISVDGANNYSQDIKEKYSLSEKRVGFIKNYYEYLWLLPMKLNDPGTNLRSVVLKKNFFGKESLEVKVNYDPEVGHDVWYFYFNPSSYALQGYRFYHDESKNDGEYIILDEETKLGNIRLPKSRKWYTHKEDKFLGEDVLEEIRIQ